MRLKREYHKKANINEVLEQLGISEEDFKKGRIVPKVVTANVPVEITI